MLVVILLTTESLVVVCASHNFLLKSPLEADKIARTDPSTGGPKFNLSWTRTELVDSALKIIKKRIDVGKRYGRELENLRRIEKRLGFSGVTEEVEALAKRYAAHLVENEHRSNFATGGQ